MLFLPAEIVIANNQCYPFNPLQNQNSPNLQMTSEDINTNTDAISTFTLTVANKMGIHARPAAMIVRLANRFSGEVWVEKDGERVNGKSIMGLMMLAAGPGSKLTFHTSGADASEMENEMKKLFDSKFEEN